MRLIIILAFLFTSLPVLAQFSFQGQNPINDSLDLDISQSYSKSLIFKNNSQLTQSITAISGSNSMSFKISVNRCLNVAPSKSCTLTIITQRDIQPKLTPYEIEIEDLDLTLNVSRAGSNDAPVAGPFLEFVSPIESIDFNTNSDTSRTVSFNVLNSGNSETSTMVSLSQSSNNAKIILNRCSTIFAKKRCSISVTFKRSLINENITLNINYGMQTLSTTINLISEVQFQFYSLMGTFEATCAINQVKKVYCWGRGVIGQTGLNTTGNIASPTMLFPDGLINGSPAISLAGGDQAGCGLNELGGVACWGRRQVGSLGNGDGTTAVVPTQQNVIALPNGEKVKSIAKNNTVGLVMISDSNKIYGFGLNDEGQISIANRGINQSSPIINQPTLSPNVKFKNGELSNRRSCYLDLDDGLWCSGRTSGSLTFDFIKIDESPLGGSKIKKIISTLDFNVYFITTEGRVHSLPPQSVSLSGPINYPILIKDMSVNRAAICAISMDDKLYCLGNNSFGQIGNGTIGGSFSEFQEVTALSALKVKEVSITGGINSTEKHVCAKTMNNSIYCWGSNLYGQIGQGVMGGNYPTPTLVNIPTN